MNILRLKEYRKKHKMSQRDVASAMDISQAYYWSWETGKSFPNAKQILQLCDIFNCSPNDLFGAHGIYEVATKDWDEE